MNLIIHTDGGARGNPGPAAVGIHITDDKNLLVGEFGKVIGETTNNVAEYTAVVEALSYVQAQVKNSISRIDFFLDSLLVVNQLNGLFRVKDAKLRELLMKVRGLESVVGVPIRYTAVRREQNTRADFLVNQALDR